MSIVDGMRSVGSGVGLSRYGFHLRPDAVAAAGRPSPLLLASDFIVGERTVAVSNGTTDVALWFKTYRDGIPCAGITISASTLRHPREAIAVKRGGHCVDVRSGEELTLAVASGIAPARIVMHGDGVNAGPIRRAAMTGAGRFVIGRVGQVSVLANCARETQQVLVDVTAHDPRAIAKVLESPRLQLVGLHARVPSAPSTVQRYAEVIGALIASMAHIRREHGVLLTRVSVAGGAELSPRPLTKRSLAPLDLACENAIDDACARYRFPRPVLNLSPEP